MKDLAAYLKKGENKNQSLEILNSNWQIENFLLTVFRYDEKTYNIKDLNERAEESGCTDVTTNKIKILLNFWSIKNWINRQFMGYSKDHITVFFNSEKELLEEKLVKRYELAKFIVEYLYSNSIASVTDAKNKEVLVEFSVFELKEAFEIRLTIFNSKITIDDVEDALFYLSKIGALELEGGFLVVYNPMDIERIEHDNKKRYKIEDYQKLNLYYENKVQQVHIVGEYANKMIRNYKEALQFVDDYFQLNYSSFLNKYFKGSRQNEIRRNITPSKFRQLFGELSPAQLKIINDKDTKYIVVAAGPGSGKTRILVHKLASLILMEDVKYEQLIMITFSRASATEFKKRLLKLIGNAANFIEIKTFHSYCFDLLGKVGTLEKSDEIIKDTIKKIKNGEVEVSKITKTVLVIDEAQDMDADEFSLINTLMEQNEDMRVIAVGDDDQNIFEFRGSSAKYMEQLITLNKAVMYELIENYRSKRNLVDFTNQIAKKITRRLKNTPIIAVQGDNGKIRLVHYMSKNLANPLVNSVLSEGLAGTTCIMTRTNEEALQVTGLLIKNGIQAKLIHSNDSFSLYNLREVRFFLLQLNLQEETRIISDDEWANAKKILVERFRGSPNLEICINMIKDFEATNTKYKYKSDLEVFIRESKLEDFFGDNIETIFVSTMHKAKGREFDNVFLMLEQLNSFTDETIRLLYVAMTRARRNLTIHYNGNYFNSVKAEDLERVDNREIYPPLCQFAMQLTFKDVWLDSFQTRQYLIKQLNSGDELSINSEGCLDSKGKLVLRFSKQFISQMESLKQMNYVPVAAKIRFIINWHKENSEQEIEIILPEIWYAVPGTT
jgi:ATP-dependent DNA helicase RecQ